MRNFKEFLTASIFLIVLPSSVFSTTIDFKPVPEGCVWFHDGTISYGCDGIHGVLKRNYGYGEECGKDYEHIISRLKNKYLLGSASSFCSTYISRTPITRTVTKTNIKTPHPSTTTKSTIVVSVSSLKTLTKKATDTVSTTQSVTTTDFETTTSLTVTTDLGTTTTSVTSTDFETSTDVTTTSFTTTATDVELSTSTSTEPITTTTTLPPPAMPKARSYTEPVPWYLKGIEACDISSACSCLIPKTRPTITETKTVTKTAHGSTRTIRPTTTSTKKKTDTATVTTTTVATATTTLGETSISTTDTTSTSSTETTITTTLGETSTTTTEETSIVSTTATSTTIVVSTTTTTTTAATHTNCAGLSQGVPIDGGGVTPNSSGTLSLGTSLDANSCCEQCYSSDTYGCDAWFYFTPEVGNSGQCALIQNVQGPADTDSTRCPSGKGQGILFAGTPGDGNLGGPGPCSGSFNPQT